MLRPEPMSRVLVVGPKDQLERVVETLYGLKLIHLLDHRGEDDTFSIGKPLPSAAEISENLVRLRSIASILQVEEAAPAERGATEDVRERIATLELHIREEDESRKKAEALLQDLDRQIEAVRPFAALGLPLDAYRGYDSLAVIVGRVADDVHGLDRAAPEAEVVAADGYVAVFAAKNAEDRTREHLAKFGFSQIDVPPGEGDPKEILARDVADREKWIARLAEIEDRIVKLRDRYARFILDAEDRLEVAIEKAEAPLRFAVSEHSFVIDGWVPTSRVEALSEAMAPLQGIHVDVLEERGGQGGHADEAEAPPVLLRNRGPARRFEFLTTLYSTPQHDELDPTAFLFFLFPVFFGLMIGDAGYGLVMIALGFLLSWKFRDSKDFADLMRVILYGGVFAYVFGMILYGEIFGIPFHGPAEEVTWSAILRYNIPYDPPIHKLENIGVIDLLLLSIVASAIHLGAGYVVGFVNEIHHNKRHAIAKIGWLLILVGFLSFFAVLARTPEWCATAPNQGCEIAGHRVANILFFDQPPLAWIPATGLLVGAMMIPFFMIGAIVVGVVFLIVGEPMGALEIISLLSNMMSYTRLAGVAVAKGAVALAFNTMFLPLIINEEAFLATGVVEWNPSVVFIILGFVLMFLAHAMVLILGAISAGIQAIRLNYVEFFLKFYRGGGKLFSPFGARKTKMEA